MADVVQYRLERMVDELEDLERRGLFSRREIAEIVKQRRKFEYRLKRPSPLKQDYIAYIDYESQLESLRLLRKRSVVIELKKKGNKRLRKSVSDYAGVVRIVEIYQLAVNRFKGDIDLWFQYLEFCRRRTTGRMKKVLAQVVRFHPKVPGIWIYAAAWQFDHNLSVTGARALMMKGLRACPDSEDLWVEYLRMELTYLHKLKARKVALGEDDGTLIHIDAEEEEWRDENKELFMSFNKDKQENDKSETQENESKKKLDFFQTEGLKMFKAVYNDAIEALPSSFSLRKRFFEILKAANLSHLDEVRTELFSEMKRNFATDPEYWDWLARLQKPPKKTELMGEETILPELQKSIQVYEEALESVPSDKMFNLYIKFLEDLITGAEDPMKPVSTKSTSNAISYLLMVYNKAETMGCMTEDLACQYISFYMQLGELDEAKKHAEKLCRGKFSGSIKLWLLRATIEIRCSTKNSLAPHKADLLAVFELLKNVLTKVSISEAKSLWLMALKFFANQKHYFDKLVEISLVLLVKYGGSDAGFSISSTIVNFVLQKDGSQGAREMYKRFLALPHPGLALYRSCIELEMNLAFMGDKDCLVNARKLFESALASHDQNVSLWRDYLSMETKLGTSETANAVSWRARKTLKDATALVAIPVL